MVNIKEITDEKTLNWIEEHQRLGGALDICVYKISENYLKQFPDEYLAHLTVARQTLEKQNYEWNFHSNKIRPINQDSNIQVAQIDYNKLDSSGKRIELNHFLGPHYDLEQNKPLIRGQKGNETLNSYFYFDDEEVPSNKVDIHKKFEDFWLKYPDNLGCFIRALMEPPYNMNFGKDIEIRGKYLLDFINYFFGYINNIIVYAWSTDSSIVFDAGKEWWGSYFWTIYNPSKNWYIGIIASETD